MRVIQGLQRPNAGEVKIGKTCVSPCCAASGRSVRTGRRPCARSSAATAVARCWTARR
ncbi:MAG: hypothetical protein ACLR3C_03530 [Eggerthella lenta]